MRREAQELPRPLRLGAQLQRTGVDAQLPRLDARQLQEVLHQPVQPLGVAVDHGRECCDQSFGHRVCVVGPDMDRDLCPRWGEVAKDKNEE